ncbi:MAG: hypothetical protein Q7Q71_15680 [Verrucomicrobiota bacterium JB023]|nr:hypothetical protein [Verrucomicrobiota bacterium JB023]
MRYLADGKDPALPRPERLGGVLLFFFWLFMMSFAFDYRVRDGSGTSIFQYAFLAGGFFSTGCLVLIGFRYLPSKPGGWIMIGWFLFLAYYLGNSFLQGVPLSRSLRTGLPFVLSFFAMLNSHIVASSGVRVAHLAAPILTTVVINIGWRMFHGFAFGEVDVTTVRAEILSPGLNWSAAFIGVCILLRSRFHWTMLLVAFLLFTAMLLSVTRALLFPMAASAVGTFICYFFGMSQGAFLLRDLPRKLSPILVATVASLVIIVGLFLAFPTVALRWQERLFSPTSDRNMASDPSLLTRQAEAKAIFDLLDESPVHYINGYGVGASFYWDDDYFPELYQVLDAEELEETSSDIWYAGHSIWTYSMFSGGFIALASFIGLFVTAVAFSLSSAAANAANPGPDHWLLYLPVVATFCLLSESATSNPFDERLLGIIFGATFSLSQAGFYRATWMASQHQRSAQAASPLIA